VDVIGDAHHQGWLLFHFLVSFMWYDWRLLCACCRVAANDPIHQGIGIPTSSAPLFTAGTRKKSR
jgi:hypothetical protein